ncbi:helix-turn-helix domain-containing protein [Frankia sp. AgB1.9]|uniref:helix-turn-helix domain-containing protein n=1 Tax=unclassified Frankia TaxID=2632575 RepID=UPI001931EBDF|nr:MULTISPECIES: helix-turn-helix domain-containing protein [unclassified Frankia]MBL7486514.1 helix-turn-helix domain-containing protein [Frankia sp. AgW1.1]MBL7554023.1 helix-turn-helix domain-containing protein [Frankia sp. AgB1.9]MBL7618211.1 helix-turn-helix domain-containing protein [Frankia sp. AgB1.8]
MKTWSAAEIRGLGVVVGLVTAGEILRIGRSKSYDLARRDEFPVPVMRIAGRYRVRTSDLMRLLGIEPGPESVA